MGDDFLCELKDSCLVFHDSETEELVKHPLSGYTELIWSEIDQRLWVTTGYKYGELSKCVSVFENGLGHEPKAIHKKELSRLGQIASTQLR